MVRFVQEPARGIPVKDEVDILVVGGGPSGIMAARAAAGKGLKVMLIESRGYVGGNLTIGLPILGFLGRKGNQVVEGLPQMLIDRLRAKGKASEHKPCKNHVSLTIIDSEEVKDVALGMLEEVGVKILFYVFCSDVIKEGNEVKAVKRFLRKPSLTVPVTQTWLTVQAWNATRATKTAECSLLHSCSA